MCLIFLQNHLPMWKSPGDNVPTSLRKMEVCFQHPPSKIDLGITNFKTRNPKNSTGLSKHIWKLEDQNIGYDVSWKIVSRAKPYNHVTNSCQLCTREKFFIIFKPEMASINERNEIAGPCLHKHSKLLKKSKS